MKKSADKKIEVSNSSKQVLITDLEHDFLMKIFEDKCLGKVQLYLDDDDDSICGNFNSYRSNNEAYSWEWAHKIYYTYDRLTSCVGKSEHEDYFKNENNELIYIFENLTNSDIALIGEIIKEHYLLFEVSSKNEDKINFFANVSHNYYAAWIRVMMKYHIYCDDYKAYLYGARQQLEYLKEHLSEVESDETVISKLNGFIDNAESFEDDDKVRQYLLSEFKKYITLIR